MGTACCSESDNSQYGSAMVKEVHKEPSSISGGTEDQTDMAESIFASNPDMMAAKSLNQVSPEVVAIIKQLGPIEREPALDKKFENDTITQSGPLKSRQTGNTYQGGICKGLPHGFGKFVSRGNMYIEGYFVKGFPDLKALQVMDDGSGYNGYLHNGKRQGQGTFISYEGEVYSGKWSEGKMNGDFTILDHDGSLLFKGKMIRNRKEGYCFFKDKKKQTQYSGDFRDGLYYGMGKLTSKEGVYEGMFNLGKKEGHGKFTEEDGTVTEGVWVKDEYKGRE
jgi:hypothetical protein